MSQNFRIIEHGLHSYCKPCPIPSMSKTVPGPKSDSDGDLDGDDDDCVYCICRTKDTNRFMIGCDSCNEWYHGDCISITEEYAKNIKQFFCLMCRERDPTLEIKFKEKKEKAEAKKKIVEKLPEYIFTSDDRKTTRRCGECANCHRTEDCRRCDFCKDMRKFGGPNRIRQKCRQRQCMNFGLIHGKNPNSPFGSQSEDTGDNKQSAQICVTPEPQIKFSNDEDEDDDCDTDYSPCNKSKYVKTKHKKKRGRQASKHRSKKVEHKRKHGEKEKTYGKKDDRIQQCYGPGCVNEVRSNSKYCSDECGMKLATNRIFEILPHRIQQWQRLSCVADESNRRSLEKIRREQQEAKDRLTHLNVKQERLERLIVKAKRTPITTDQDSQDGDAEEEDTVMSTYCVTCGHEISAKNALKHMEKCFNKYESQTSFGSFYQTNIEGSNIFCDFFNPQQRTYCKRLQILCPEHSKEPKVSDNEVCGSPLVIDLFEPSGECCRLPKKKCIKHYQWEKYQRAEIDLEKMRILFKLDDLIEQERSIRQQMANRGGVLGLMLHQTVCHDQVTQ